MDCHAFETDLDALLAGDLPGGRAAACRSHAAGCRACGELLELAGMTLGEADDGGSGPAAPPDLVGGVLAATGHRPCHRARELLCDHVDGALAAGETALVAAHLEACDDCRELAAVVAGLARELPALAEPDPGPGFTASVLARSLSPAARLRRWWRSSWERWNRRPRFALEAAYAATVALVLVVATPGSPAGELAGRALEMARSRPRLTVPAPVTAAPEELARAAATALEPPAQRTLETARAVLDRTGRAAENVRRSFGTLFDDAASSSTGADAAPRPTRDATNEEIP